MIKRIGSATLAALLTLTGCSTASKNIAADYVSPMQYSSYDFDQVGAEMGWSLMLASAALIPS